MVDSTIPTTIAHKEMFGSRTESFVGGKFAIRRRFAEIPYLDRFKFVASLLGGIDNNDGVISIINPDQDPYIPGVFAKDITSIVGYPLARESPKGILYDKCFMDVLYATPEDGTQGADQEDGADVLFQEFSVDGAPLMVDIPNRSFRFKDDATRAISDQNIPLLVGSMTFGVDLKFVPSLPFALWQKTLGRVNKDPFEGLDAGKVLFSAARARKSFYLSTDGQVTGAFSVSLSFTWREFEWNKAPHPLFGNIALTVDGVFIDGPSELFQFLDPPLYEEVGFGPLLQLGIATQGGS